MLWVYIGLMGVRIMCIYLGLRIHTRDIGRILGIISVYVRFKVMGARATGEEDP